MTMPDIHFIGFLPEDNRKILGLTDDLEYPFLPLLINHSIFSLNIINGIQNNFSSYSFLFDYDNKKIVEYLSNPGFSVRFEQIGISTSDNFRYFSNSIINFINNSKISEEDYLAFIPCNINYLWFFEKDKLKENCYILNFSSTEEKGFIIKSKFIKFIFEKEKIEHFKDLYKSIIENIKLNIQPQQQLKFIINNLKDYLDLHLLLYQIPELNLFINSLSHFFDKIGESYISKEGEILNSFVGHNSVIRGKVEDSIIFNDVIILSDTHVQNSIILPGNVLAKGVKIKNCIIGINKNPMKDITIGPSTKIGFPSHNNLKNIVYENELPEGYSLIGNGILLPGGINIGKNCVLRGKINILELKKMKTLVDGGTFEQDNNI